MQGRCGVHCTSLSAEEQSGAIGTKLATLEMRELNEKQRADLAVARCRQLQKSVVQLERRNGELEGKFAELSRTLLESQTREAELMDKVAGGWGGGGGGREGGREWKRKGRGKKGRWVEREGGREGGRERGRVREKEGGWEGWRGGVPSLRDLFPYSLFNS